MVKLALDSVTDFSARTAAGDLLGLSSFLLCIGSSSSPGGIRPGPHRPGWSSLFIAMLFLVPSS